MLVSLLFCIELYFGLFFCHAPASARRLIKNLLTYLLTCDDNNNKKIDDDKKFTFQPHYNKVVYSMNSVL